METSFVRSCLLLGFVGEKLTILRIGIVLSCPLSIDDPSTTLLVAAGINGHIPKNASTSSFPDVGVMLDRYALELDPALLPEEEVAVVGGVLSLNEKTCCCCCWCRYDFIGVIAGFVDACTELTTTPDPL